MKFARDTQRKRVYDAERTAFGSHCAQPLVGDGSVAAAQAYIDRVLARDYIQRHFPRARSPVRVTDGRGRGRGGARVKTYGADLLMPRFTRSDWYLLHELAHHLSPPSATRAWHGWHFCAAYLDLVRHIMGREAHDKLRDAFRQHRVKYRPPRPPLSEEERARRAARLLQSVAERA